MASPELRFRMAVDAAQLKGTRDQVRLFLHAHAVAEDVALDILLCVNEACANAIQHSDSTSGIDVAVRLEEGCVSIVVGDEGLGSVLDLRDLRRDPGPLASDGRGLYVMSCLMDELQVHLDGGTQIRMIKRFTPPPPLASEDPEPR